MNHRLKIFTILLALLPVLTAQARVQVSARLDSVSILMGSMTTLGLEVVQDQGKPGGFTVFRNADPAKGYVGVCGDSVELRTSYKVDTVQLGSGRVQFNYRVPVQAFDSGTYRLPEFVYVSDGDSARSNAVTLNVTVMKVTAEDPIAGFAPVAEPEGKKFTDAVPDWMIDWWWLILALLAAIGVFAWAMRRYRKEGTVLPRKPEPSPYETAIKALTELKAQSLWEQGMEKEYFTRLTDILRTYLQKRFGINAMEMTTREIMECLRTDALRDKREYVRRILNVADFVKFAKVRPLPADNVEAYDNALRFVEETKPEPKPEETEEGAKETAGAVNPDNGNDKTGKDKKGGAS